MLESIAASYFSTVYDDEGSGVECSTDGEAWPAIVFRTLGVSACTGRAMKQGRNPNLQRPPPRSFARRQSQKSFRG